MTKTPIGCRNGMHEAGP